MKIKQFFTSIMGSLLIGINAMGITALAETSLPDGAVKGLPERLAALDDEGNAVNSATGEYFFHVEDMQFGEVYSKNIQLMNLREDYSYHIYFYVEPLFKAGEIDLEKGCECSFFLDGEEIYRGDVNGKGNFDLSEQHFDCGNYEPGESHVLRCEIVWNDIDVIQNVDNGHRLVDKDGEHVLVGPCDSGYAEGEIEFKWIFYAMVDVPDSQTDLDDRRSSVPDKQESAAIPTSKADGFFPPYTGAVLKNGTVWLAAMGVITVMIAVLLVLIKKQKKDKDK